MLPATTQTVFSFRFHWQRPSWAGGGRSFSSAVWLLTTFIYYPGMSYVLLARSQGQKRQLLTTISSQDSDTTVSCRCAVGLLTPFLWLAVQPESLLVLATDL